MYVLVFARNALILQPESYAYPSPLFCIPLIVLCEARNFWPIPIYSL